MGTRSRKRLVVRPQRGVALPPHNRQRQHGNWVGSDAGSHLTTDSNNIDIGNAGVAGESNTIRIGNKGTHENTFIAGISGVIVAKGVEVIVDANGHLGTVVSSESFKDAIKPMDKAALRGSERHVA